MKATLTSTPYSQQHQVDSSPTKHIEESTLSYLHTSFLLWEYKTSYDAREYRQLLDDYGWDKGSSEEQRALKIAKHFQQFVNCPEQLAPIPVTILLKLCSKNYRSIIDLLVNYPPSGLTCQIVLDLIEEREDLLKAEKQQQLELEKEKEKLSIWRRTPKGERYCQFPPQWDESQQTGVLAQDLIDNYGLIPQTILREAIADYHAKITHQEQSQIETAELMVESETSETFLQVDTRPLENEKASQEIIPQEQVLFPQVQGADSDNQKQCTTSSNNIETATTLDSNLTSSTASTQPVEMDEASILVEKLKSATSYYQIRSAIYRHLSVKDKAWEQLPITEKSRIEKLLPQEMLLLNQARDNGLILDYYELETGYFQIFIEYENKPVSVSKSSIISWLKEQETLNCVTG